jgi:hypothetical protein
MGATLSEFIALVNLPAMTEQQLRLQMQLLDEPDDGRRDRLWTCHAPSLMQDAAATLDFLITLPDVGTGQAPTERQRLGLYYEDLVGELLGLALARGPLHRNVQCIRQGITAGEFDFLYRDRQQWIHLETAVKYYLCCGDGSALHHYVGPGRRDRLDIKWQRLQQHQLNLACQEAGRDTLARMGIMAPQPRLLMPGYLFYRAGVEPPADALHRAISPLHLRGWWIPLAELERLQDAPERRYALLPKLRWLSPARLPLAQTLNWHQLQERLLQCNHPTLVAQLSPLPDSSIPDKAPGEIQGDAPGEELLGETGRGFIVPDGWDADPVRLRAKTLARLNRQAS